MRQGTGSWVVFGANSAGKSTLMYTLSGIMEDIRKKELMAGGERITIMGEIRFLGEEITGLKPSLRAKRGIVLCPERRRIFKESSVMENLRIGGYLATPSQAKETTEYVFEIFPGPVETEKTHRGFFERGGEQQMLAIGRALMAQPKTAPAGMKPLLGLSPLMQAILIRGTKVIRDERKDLHHRDGTVRQARAPHRGLRLYFGKWRRRHGGNPGGALEQPGYPLGLLRSVEPRTLSATPVNGVLKPMKIDEQALAKELTFTRFDRNV